MQTTAPSSRGLLRQSISGWPLVWGVTGVLSLGLAALVAAYRLDGEVMRLAIRITARTSLLLFCLAFCAAGAWALWPGALTSWQRANRRYLGLAFAGSHGLHGLAIIGYAVLDPAPFAAYMTPAMYALGGVGYVFIALMAATSFDATARSIGPTAWRWLHLAGSYYLWLSFFNGFGRRALADASYWPWVALLVTAMAVRLAGKGRDRAR
ncbi:MAG: hypothetical protein NW223_00205 [Hyphomicrobiaceae bacterium]|nr:hypothetical protein [Hyphomicrobiaceae bacterium]